MYKFILLFVVPIFCYSQVTIGVDSPNPSAMLNINTTDKVFVGPKVKLKELTNGNSPIANVKEGSLVYNETANSRLQLYKGYYYWNGTRWVRLNQADRNVVYVTNNINMNEHLGYSVNSYNPSMIESTFPRENERGRERCIRWAKNGHYYCVINVGDEGVKWYQAFQLAKQTGGYLATLTSIEEFNFIQNNLPSNANKTAIGLHYSEYATTIEILKKMKWITGEENAVIRPNGSNVTSISQSILSVLETSTLPGYDSGTANNKCGILTSSNSLFTTIAGDDCTNKYKQIIIEYND